MPKKLQLHLLIGKILNLNTHKAINVVYLTN